MSASKGEKDSLLRETHRSTWLMMVIRKRKEFDREGKKVERAGEGESQDWYAWLCWRFILQLRPCDRTRSKMEEWNEEWGKGNVRFRTWKVDRMRPILTPPQITFYTLELNRNSISIEKKKNCAELEKVHVKKRSATSISNCQFICLGSSCFSLFFFTHISPPPSEPNSIPLIPNWNSY